MLPPVEEMKYHPRAEQIVALLTSKTQNTRSDTYFRVLTAYFFGQMAASMRAKVITEDRGTIPVNVYAMALMTSGAGKGHSLNVMEDEIVNQFKDTFLKSTFPAISELAIEAEAQGKSVRNGTDFQDELDALNKEFDSYGAMPYSFSEGTGPAFRQIRTKAQIAGAGCLNFCCDEVGSNLNQIQELLTVGLECYTGDVEILTTEGYKRFDNLTGTESIAQYNETGTIEYVPNTEVTFIRKPYSGLVYDFVTPTGFDFTVTENHMMTVASKKGVVRKKKPSELFTSDCIIIGKSVIDRNEHITDGLRLLIAFQADGTFKKAKSRIEFGFTKERKIVRMKQLLQSCGIPWNEYALASGHTVFSILREALPWSKDLSDFIDPLEVDLTTIREILEETVHWDGSAGNGYNRYTTTHAKNAELIAWLASVSGYKSRLRHLTDDRSEKFSDVHYVEWNPKEHTPGAQLAYLNSCSGNQKPIRTSRLFDGEVFCVSVPTSHIIIRRNGVSSVGGNCYDIGKIKQKLIKNNADNKRAEERDAPVPTNILLFGTPAKVFNGSTEEKEVLSLLETGYARRLLFGFGNKGTEVNYSPEELYDMLCAASKVNNSTSISDYFGNLADPINLDAAITVSRNIGIKLMTYKMNCEALADKMPEQNEIHKAEMNHRYFKVLKLMGAYAFVDCTGTITEEQLYGAIKVVEDSGIAFNEILNRPKPYERLATYLASTGEATLADLDNDLIYFKGANAKKQEMIQLATAWGYKNNIIIKKYFVDNIEFFKGEALQETNIDEMVFSLSDHEAYRYAPMVQPFNMLHRMTQAQGFHWANHNFADQHRNGENVLTGFNMIVIDCDGTVSWESAQLLLREYTAHYYTTKRHTDDAHRFRIVLPMKYHLKLNEKEFKEFMGNIFAWLPFDTDEETAQRSKKWLSHAGTFHYNEGELFDPRPFIPKTSKNVQMQESIKDLSNLDRVEAWFARTEVQEGNRNRGLMKYAFMLLDAGYDGTSAEQRVLEFNAKLPDPLTETELQNTVLKSLWAKVSKNS